jgi:hypothetical protein
MAGAPNTAPFRFPGLRFKVALKAARDFGLDPEIAETIAMRYDPRAHDFDHMIDALALALLVQGAVTVPDSL